MEWGQFWWNSVYGPKSIINTIVEYLAVGKSVLCTSCSNIPWRNEMLETARDTIIQSGVVSEIYIINAATDLLKSHTPGDYLVGKFTNRDGYRPHKEEAWEYLKRTKAFKSRLLWIYAIPEHQLTAWNELCRKLKGSCVFIIESEGNNQRVSGSELLDISKYFSENDYLLLSSQIVAERRDVPNLWKRYLADLAVQAFKGDGVRTAQFSENYNIELSPSEYDARMTSTAVWRAQLRNIFHLIEEERTKFISRYEDEIRVCLPEFQFQEEVINPHDAELGLLWHLTNPEREGLGKKLLIIPQSDYEHLCLLRNVRNKLAHCEILTPDEMHQLLEKNTGCMRKASSS